MGTQIRAAGFFIRANVFGKIRYWCNIDGLHTGRSEAHGFQIYQTEAEAKKEIRKLKNVFHKGIIWQVLPEEEIPFIKKQITARLKEEKKQNEKRSHK